MLRTLSIITFLFFPLSGWGQETTNVGWGGWGYLAPSEDIAELAPHTHLALQQDPALEGKLSTRIHELLKAAISSRPDLRLVSQNISYEDDTYVIFFAITADYVEVTRVKDDAIAGYNLQVLVLVVNVSKDPGRQRIVYSVPVRIRWRQPLVGGDTLADHANVFRKLLVEPLPEMPDVVAEWAQQAGRVKLREKSVWVRVEPTVLSDSAQATLMGMSKTRSQKEVSEQIPLRTASILEGQVSSMADIPTVPFGANSATQKLTLTISDRRAAMRFSPPEPQYSMNVLVDELRLIETVVSPAPGVESKAMGFAARVVFRMYEEDGVEGSADRTSLLELPLKSLVAVELADVTLEPPQEFARLLVQFSRELGEAFVEVDGEWFERARSAQEKRKPKDVVSLIKQARQRL
jgi:hypothetical protein